MFGSGRPARLIALSVAAATIAALVPAAVHLEASAAAPRVAPASVGATSPVKVIVRADSSAVGRAAVEAAGGQVTHELPIIDGVSAIVPGRSLADVVGAAGVRAVTPDGTMHVQGTLEQFDGAPLAEGAAAANPPSVYRKVIRADKLASKGYTGAGVTVALLDTGISPSPEFEDHVLQVKGHGLFDPDEDCVNLSGEPNCDDGYGHGTFLAGIIAGNGAASGGAYQGVAPDADLVSIKVAAGDGSADVSNVLAGIQWAVSFKDDYDIRVLNLSLGTDSEQSWTVDPLNYAVETAWDAGIVVVVAASNRGPAAGTISKPGDDPWVVTVGATEDRGTVKLGDDRVPDFSARGPTSEGVAKPDVVAPGAHIVSLAAAGSLIAEGATPILDTYIQGSGTSMSTAVVSGAVAAILSAKPAFEPNRVKFILKETARAGAGQSEAAIGDGVIDAYAAAAKAPVGEANTGLQMSSGAGSLDLSRGSVYVQDADLSGTVVDGEYTAQLIFWNPLALIPGAPSWYSPWTKVTWWLFPWQLSLLYSWLPTKWYGDNWEGDNWEGCSKGSQHQDACTYGEPTSGSTWYGTWD